MIVLVSATTLMSLYLQVTKQVVKFMATEKLENTQLIKVRVEKNKINWVDKDQELRINNALFDVKSYTTLPSGDIVCIGIYDSAEQNNQWKIIQTHSAVTVTIDLFYVGLVYFREGQAKEDFKIRF